MIVKVYSTQMGEKEVETSATTWGHLQDDLRKNGITYDGMKSVIGESKLTLEADAAMLPAEGFTLFLMPKKTKAGAMDVASMGYKALRAEICEILKSSDNAKDHFNVGKNYTTKGTEELRGLLMSWLGLSRESVKEMPKEMVQIPVAKEEAFVEAEDEIYETDEYETDENEDETEDETEEEEIFNVFSISSEKLEIISSIDFKETPFTTSEEESVSTAFRKIHKKLSFIIDVVDDAIKRKEEEKRWEAVAMEKAQHQNKLAEELDAIKDMFNDVR